MSLNAGVLTFKEFAMREQLPLATIHDAVLEFLRGRDDAVVFGAQAVNAYGLLLTFPELKKETGAVSEALKSLGANDDVMETWGDWWRKKSPSPRMTASSNKVTTRRMGGPHDVLAKVRKDHHHCLVISVGRGNNIRTSGIHRYF